MLRQEPVPCSTYYVLSLLCVCTFISLQKYLLFIRVCVSRESEPLLILIQHQLLLTHQLNIHYFMIFLFEIIKLWEIDTLLSPFFFSPSQWYLIWNWALCVYECVCVLFWHILSLLCQIFHVSRDISMKFQTSRQFTAVDCFCPVPLLIKYTGKY